MEELHPDMNTQPTIERSVLLLDASTEVRRTSEAIRNWVRKEFKRQGAVVGLSGGIDSSVTAALCVEALGADRVLGLLMPERDSSEDTLELSRCVADHLGIDVVHQDITSQLEAAGCYEKQVEAVRTVLPDLGPDDRFKITLPGILDGYTFRVFSVVARSPTGEERKARLTPEAYLAIVAATNFKQRVRKMLEYYHADRLNYAVAGTPNRLEYDQGFFVKLGDGAADFKPIAHLYKTQVFQLGAHLGIPDSITQRPPTTDTYSLPQSQEEFYFSVPYDQMDLCLYGVDNQLAPEAVAHAAGLSPEQVANVYKDIGAKRNASRYLHASARSLYTGLTA